MKLIHRTKNFFLRGGLSLGLLFFSGTAFSLDMDWSGQFWSQYHLLTDYSLDSHTGGEGYDATRATSGGYYIPGGGRRAATFLNLFLRLRPCVIVNDNLYLKSEWWIGDPVYSVFGGALPRMPDARRYDSTQSFGSPLSVQRVWAEFVTDAGTVQVGRVPLSWGLGVMWNPGEALWSRSLSTGDAIRWMVQFGSFKVIPSLIWQSAGNNFGGNYRVSGSGVGGGPVGPSPGSGNVMDYALAVQYENSEDEVEAGIHIVKRVAGVGQDSFKLPQGFHANTTDRSMNYTTYNFFFQKKFYHLRLGVEVPVINGNLGGAGYHASGLASELDWQPSEMLSFLLRSGYASGQKNTNELNQSAYEAFYFHPNYHIGMILFQYQLANLSGPNTRNGSTSSDLRSPYDAAINDAAYFSLSTPIKPSDRWTIQPTLTYAFALKTASDAGYFFNTWTRQMVQSQSGVKQGKSYGWELDLSFVFQWDESLRFAWDHGLFMPGSFYAFSNAAYGNHLDPVYATSVRVGVVF